MSDDFEIGLRLIREIFGEHFEHDGHTKDKDVKSSKDNKNNKNDKNDKDIKSNKTTISNKNISPELIEDLEGFELYNKVCGLDHGLPEDAKPEQKPNPGCEFSGKNNSCDNPGCACHCPSSGEDLEHLSNSVAKERDNQWGDTYKRIAPLAKEILGIDLTSKQFCGLMMLMKLMRWYKSNFKSRDCLVDLINYAKLADKAD